MENIQFLVHTVTFKVNLNQVDRKNLNIKKKTFVERNNENINLRIYALTHEIYKNMQSY